MSTTTRVQFSVRMPAGHAEWIRQTAARMRVPGAALTEVAVSLLRAELDGDASGDRWRELVSRHPLVPYGRWEDRPEGDADETGRC